MNASEIKLCCNLTSPELQVRKESVLAELKKLVLERIETEHGFKYRFEGSDNTLDRLNDFIKSERLCCDFFIFTLTVSGITNATWLEIMGPEGTKEFIRDEIDF